MPPDNFRSFHGAEEDLQRQRPLDVVALNEEERDFIVTVLARAHERLKKAMGRMPEGKQAHAEAQLELDDLLRAVALVGGGGGRG